MIYNPWKIQQILDDIWYMTHNNKPNKTIEKDIDYWLISDTHFNHIKVQEYCGRPDGWQELIISNWNSVVKEDDIVLHLGDFAFGNKASVYAITERLNGEIFMIKGNHDRHSKIWYEDVGIHRISPAMLSLDGSDDTLYFTHRQIKENDFIGINIHGHMHNTTPYIKIEKTGVYVNVSVEVINYTPIRLSKVIEDVQDRVSRIYDTSLGPLMREDEKTMKTQEILREVPIYHMNGLTCVDTRKISDEYREEFGQWMYGQTFTIVNGLFDYVYSWDWERWVMMKFGNVPTYFD